VILDHFIAIPVDERLSHPLGMVNVIAEDDGFGEAITAGLRYS